MCWICNASARHAFVTKNDGGLFAIQRDENINFVRFVSPKRYAAYELLRLCFLLLLLLVFAMLLLLCAVRFISKIIRAHWELAKIVKIKNYFMITSFLSWMDGIRFCQTQADFFVFHFSAIEKEKERDEQLLWGTQRSFVHVVSFHIYKSIEMFTIVNKLDATIHIHAQIENTYRIHGKNVNRMRLDFLL